MDKKNVTMSFDGTEGGSEVYRGRFLQKEIISAALRAFDRKAF